MTGATQEEPKPAHTAKPVRMPTIRALARIWFWENRRAIDDEFCMSTRARWNLSSAPDVLPSSFLRARTPDIACSYCSNSFCRPLRNDATYPRRAVRARMMSPPAGGESRSSTFLPSASRNLLRWCSFHRSSASLYWPPFPWNPSCKDMNFWTSLSIFRDCWT